MVSARPVFRTRSTEWSDFADQMRDLRTQLPQLEMRALEEIRDGILRYLFTRITSRTVWTSTYLNSLRGGVIQFRGKPAVVVELQPTGPEAERLPIYWKVLERGAQPNPEMPRKALLTWSRERFGTAAVGLGLIKLNRSLSRGVLPNPVLSAIFVLDGSFNPVGLTAQGQLIVESALRELMSGVGSFMRRGRRVVVRRSSTGRFARL